MSIHSPAVLDKKFIEMMKLLNIYLNHFPKHEKYALCNVIRNTAYQLYDLITEAQKKHHKKTTLSMIDITHEKLRMQIRLAHELNYFAYKDERLSEKSPEILALHRLTALQRLIDEFGRMIGGWIVHERAQEKGNALTCCA